MNHRDTLCTLFDLYCSQRQLSDARVSTLVFNHGARIGRIRAGAGFTVDTYTRAIQWFSDHWPTDLPWPPDIPRPVSLPPSAGPAADGAPGEEAAPEYGEQPRFLADWCRQHGFEERQARKVIELYGDAGRLAGRKPRRQTRRVTLGQTYFFKNERYMIWEQFIKDRDPRFKQAIAFTDMAGLITAAGGGAA